MMSSRVDAFPHLRQVSAEIAVMADEFRISTIQSGFWVPYQRVKDILADLEMLFTHARINRMPHRLIIAPSNNGKSELLQHFLRLHPSDPNPNGEVAKFPVVLVSALGPDIGDLCGRILDAVHAPYREKASAGERIRAVTKVLGQLGTRMLLVDEINNMLTGGAVKQREFRNGIKDLGNELRMSIVAAGVEDAYTAFSTDPQLSNRFTPWELPLWKLDNEGGALLASFERRLPLRKPSGLKSPEIFQKVLWMSEGLIGEIYEVLKRAAIQAIRDGEERITLEGLGRMPWKRPSERRERPALV